MTRKLSTLCSLYHRELLSQLLRNWWFHFLIILFTSFTGILITRQYQYTKRINFLQRMLVTNSLSPSLSLSLSLSCSCII